MEDGEGEGVRMYGDASAPVNGTGERAPDENNSSDCGPSDDRSGGAEGVLEVGGGDVDIGDGAWDVGGAEGAGSMDSRHS